MRAGEGSLARRDIRAALEDEGVTEEDQTASQATGEQHTGEGKWAVRRL